MKKGLQYTGFAIGLIVLFLLFQFQFNENNSWKSWNLPLSGKIIILDPGHGGPDGGAVGGDVVLEKDISLKVAHKLKDYLQEQGALVEMTREGDYDLAPKDMKGYSRRKSEDLRKRVEYINRSEADIFVSIHLNAIPSAKWRGAQTFFYHAYRENENLAKYIQDELRKNLENTSRKARPIDNVYLLKNVKKPGSLVEVGFLSNGPERDLLVTDNYQEMLADSIYKGIMRYFTNEKKPPE